MSILLDPANSAEALPPLVTSGCSWIGLYDFTNSDALSLISQCDYYTTATSPPGVSSSGLTNRIATAYNRLGSGVSGNTPDLTAAPNYVTLTGPKWRNRHVGSRGAAYFDMAAYGLSTPQTTMNLATPGSMATGNACTVSCTGTYPTLAYGVMAAATTYYLVKNADNTFSFARTSSNGTNGFVEPMYLPGTGTLTITDTTLSVSSTVTSFNTYGLPMSTGQQYSIVDVITFDRWRLVAGASARGGAAANAQYRTIGGIGPVGLYQAGVANSSYAGRLAMTIDGNNHYTTGMYPLESANLGCSAVSNYDGQTLIIVRAMSLTGGSVSNGPSVIHYVNGVQSSVQGDHIVTPATPLSQIWVGDSPFYSEDNLPSGHSHHYMGIISGQVNSTDVANITAAFNAKMFNPIGKISQRKIIQIPMPNGQSNGVNRGLALNISGYTGTVTSPAGIVYSGNPNNLLGYSSPIQRGEDAWAGLTGYVGVDSSAYSIAGNVTLASGGQPLLESEQNWTNSTTPSSTGAQGWIDDMGTISGGGVVQGTPSTYIINAISASAGQLLTTWAPSYLTTQGNPKPICMGWTQNETDAANWGQGTNSNANTTGCYYSSYNVYQSMGKHIEGMGILFGRIFNSVFGLSSPLIMGLQPVLNVGINPHITDQIYADQNPTTAFMLHGNPYHWVGYSSVHYFSYAYEYLMVESARVWSYYLASKGLLYTENCSGPQYGLFPRIQSVLATHGNSYIDVTISNPNNAGSLLINSTQPMLGWRVTTGTTTQAVYTTGALSGATTSGSQGTCEINGTNLIGGGATPPTGTPTLTAPFTIRLPLPSALPAAGTKLTVYYSDGTTMAAMKGTSWPQTYECFNTMLTDNAATTCPAEPLLDPTLRRNMPVCLEACGVTTTIQ